MNMPGMEGMNEEGIEAGLLEKLMELMDGRIAGGAMPEHAGKKGGAVIEIAVGPSGESGDDLDKDPELDDEMKEIIRAQRGY